MFLVFSLFFSITPEVKEDSLKNQISDPWLSSSDRWISEDKFLHFAHSAAISSSTYLIMNKMGNIESNQSIYISMSLTSLAGFLKELSDSKKEDEDASLKDLIYDIAGTVTGILLVKIGGS